MKVGFREDSPLLKEKVGYSILVKTKVKLHSQVLNKILARGNNKAETLKRLGANPDESI